MSVRFRPASILAGLLLATVATAAAARDYVVVNSTDPAVARGQSFPAGARLALPVGQTVTLMHASGDLVRLKGAAGGIVLPRRAASQGDADRLAILKVIVAPADRQAAGLVSMRKTRSICPAPEAVRTLDDIVQVHRMGCKAVATEALEAWLAARPAVEADAP